MRILKTSGAILSPIFLVGLLVTLELCVFRDRDPIESLDNRLKSVEIAVKLSSDLVSLFISIATAIIGAVAYYLRSRFEGFDVLPLPSVACLVLCLVACVLSIYFGHLEVVTMRNQLAADSFEPTSWVMQWTERLQFGALIASLGWFGLLVVERETSRRPQPKERSSAAGHRTRGAGRRRHR